jgi:hypothetical protein
VMRFRIVKLAPGTPAAPDMRASAATVVAPGRHAETPPSPPAAPAETPVAEPA